MSDKSKAKVLVGSMNYEITIDADDLSTRYEDNNENRLISYLIVQKACEDYQEMQKQPHPVEMNLSKAEMKELQITQSFLKKHIATLGAHILKKYEHAVPEKDKPKIEIVKDLSTIKKINDKAKRK